jgi:hypothetical protein
MLSPFGWLFVVCGGPNIVYDLMLAVFRRVRPPEESD